ncbi:MAG: hypothetical protein KatS3mg027_1285 [Bacteroidia bacterium]|nr:MAG: hypothetical protein KatS3mg027_1285 [Bacteroidia bacterium]
MHLKNNLKIKTYQSSSATSLKQNIPSIEENNNPLVKNYLNIINANNQIQFFSKQAA